MPKYQTTDGHIQLIVPLMIAPYSHQALPTITGNPFSDAAGTVLYGHYNMEYRLPGGDCLRLIANHNQKTVQLVLLTNQAELIKQLPGERTSSLIANLISAVQRYRICSDSYVHPLTPEQEEKLQIANQCIKELETLLEHERQLEPNNHVGQEGLRKATIAIIERCRDQNRLLADHPLISEGTLGDALYNAHKIAQHYLFNRFYAVSREDQMDFSNPSKNLVWDSELHIGHNSHDLDDALRVICQYYQLNPAPNLHNLPANRFAKISAFFHKLWHDSQDWVNYLTSDIKPQHKTKEIERADGVSITQITPYYTLQGLTQKPYPDLEALIQDLTRHQEKPIPTESVKKGEELLRRLGSDKWVLVKNEHLLMRKQGDEVVKFRYFTHQDQFYLLPTGQDLYTLAQISKRHLYFPERATLKIKAFLSNIASFFNNLLHNLNQFIVHDLQEEFINHVHASHPLKVHHATPGKQDKKQQRSTFVKVLKNNGYLTNGQTLEEFIQEQLSKSSYVIARPKHLPNPPAYENPLHRIVGVIRHVARIFINTSERNPLIGTLAMAAYAYGGCAVLAPELLKNVLNKLYLNGLISGIEPTQKLAHLLNHSKYSEAVSASALFWQGTIAGGNLDKFFIQAVQVLKDDPGEIAIIAALALSLGYGMTKAIPALGNEMGDFPYTNYAALGGKTGAAVYDVIMHPGDDWLLGTCKWFCKGIVTQGKLFIAPFFEAYYYGFHGGFVNGWKKSWGLLSQLGKQNLAASTDLLLALLTIPLLELSALFIHIPFRGVTGLLTKTLGFWGNISSLGNLLIVFATRPHLADPLISYKLSALYGFNSPFAHFSDNKIINFHLNILNLLFKPLMQLIKNLLILPIIDFIALSVRLGIAIANPSSRLLAYSTGSVLYAFGTVWDRTIGPLFTLSARYLTSAFNWIDNQAGALKQELLSQIEIIRSDLYQWAFAKNKLKPRIGDSDYFINTPERYERTMPHNKSHCLLNALLNEGQPSNEFDKQPVYTDLFGGQHWKSKPVGNKDPQLETATCEQMSYN